MRYVHGIFSVLAEDQGSDSKTAPAVSHDSVMSSTLCLQCWPHEHNDMQTARSNRGPYFL